MPPSQVACRLSAKGDHHKDQRKARNAANKPGLADGRVAGEKAEADGKQFAEPLGRWFGLNDAEIDAALPNLSNFSALTPAFV